MSLVEAENRQREDPNAPAESPAGSDVLVLDPHTLEDLEIFGTQSSGVSLFKFCNRTRTDGGARVLRGRMETPWASADRIRSTQQAVSFIMAQRQAFTALPSAYIARRVERYIQEVLPAVRHEDPLRFAVEAFAFWAEDDRHYIRVLTGVRFTCKLLEVLRRFLRQPELSRAAGEIAPLLEQMRALVHGPRLAGIPDWVNRGRFWKILGLDQVFRRHEKAAMARLLELVYEVDALVAMADVTRMHGFVLPSLEEGPPRVRAEGLIHPFLEASVANPVALDQQRRLLLLTGPNMAGKTTYLRAFAIALYLGHLGMGVPASRFSFVPVQRLFSSISLRDDLAGGVSYFRAEALRIKAIAQAIVAGHRVVALLDEPFKGTNMKDAMDASQAILERFAHADGCLFVFSSHLIELSQRLAAEAHIDYGYFAAEEGEGRLRFDYTLRAGVSRQRLGMRVLGEEGIFELLDGLGGRG